MTEHHPNIDVRKLGFKDLAAVHQLHAEAFGPGRFARTAYRIREGAPSVSPHCRVATRSGELVGAVTMTEIAVGSTFGHWLLGPLAVRADDINKGFGQQLIATALQSITDHTEPRATVILVGDLAYYSRHKFEVVPRGQIIMPGPVDPARLLIWRGADGSRPIPSGPLQLTPAAASS